MADEWGPWIEHDGKGCPCPGVYVFGLRANGDTFSGFADELFSSSVGPIEHDVARRGRGLVSLWEWLGKVPQCREIVRYQIRKSRGFLVLEALVSDPSGEVRT